ncbi:IS66 family insertion sequence element accessory protein TnpB [Pseudenhygromyxa sp. WMMC2535]|uniref:IS66 family insertion sequence element accessory protein TnpB n=1 Tax=Pseudenhygromyxa sp. WMMC2535 TaxID=2712867 RepID=UPI001555A33F|nr:IS66 family insertion sequence element accessory protein TnpB [Pseudenhygromyxa sp. WMMC2535]NVB41543.1 IS66 family insertion sequence element accessory protein TnpB [Pseudenhygromyxa sp. WMMC2535]
MLSLPPTVRIFVALEPVDLRKGFDGLANVARTVLAENPLSGHLFVFLNRRGNRAKILFWDRSGWCIYYKRLERGRFRLRRRSELGEGKVELEAAELLLILEGIDLEGARRQPRWQAKKSTSRACTTATS